MSNKQKILIACAVITAITLIFPPFHFVGDGGMVRNAGYRFIFTPPNYGTDSRFLGVVDIKMLLVEWVGIWAISILLINCFKEKR